eukprot:m.49488 g.49488  ORF g.49488 m.49488 type:complete len:597 (-) comp7124_c0_seq1:158-1948(-)
MPGTAASTGGATGRGTAVDTSNRNPPDDSFSSSGSEWDPDQTDESESDDDGSDPEDDDDDDHAVHGADTGSRGYSRTRVESSQNVPTRRLLVATADFNAEMEGDLSFRVGDEFEYLGKGLDASFIKVCTLHPPHTTGYIPASFVKEADMLLRDDREATTSDTPSVETLVSEHRLPGGFRPSLLARLARRKDHTLAHAVRPTLASHGLGLADLQYATDARRPATRLAPNPTALSLAFELTAASNVPEPAAGKGITVVAQAARVAVMRSDRTIVGSVVTVRAAPDGPMRWAFGRGRQFPGGSNSDNALLVRFDGDPTTHSLVIELSYVLQCDTDPSVGQATTGAATPATSSAGHRGGSGGDGRGHNVIASCGWTHVELADVPGLVGRTHDQPLAGGTPAETAVVDLKPVVAGEGRTLKGASFLRRSSSAAPKAPTITFKFVGLRPSSARVADTLPVMLLAPLSMAPLLSTFRAYLMDAFAAATAHARDASTVAGVPCLYDPAVATFLELCRHPVALSVFHTHWRTECRARGRRRQAKNTLRRLLLQHVNLVVFTHAFNDPHVNDADMVAALRFAMEPATVTRPPPPKPFDVRELVVDA